MSRARCRRALRADLRTRMCSAPCQPIRTTQIASSTPKTKELRRRIMVRRSEGTLLFARFGGLFQGYRVEIAVEFLLVEGLAREFGLVAFAARGAGELRRHGDDVRRDENE